MNSRDREVVAVRSYFVRPFRTGEMVGDMRKNPAPPWIAALVDAFIDAAATITEIYTVGPAIGWCLEGEPHLRASHLLTIMKLWPGPQRLMIVSLFLDAAQQSGAGAAKGSHRRPPSAVQIPAEWPPLPEKAELK